MTATADLLQTIIAATQRSVAVRSARVPERELERRITRAPRGAAFEAALRTSPPPRIVAECKRRSPSRGILRVAYDPAAHAAAYAEAGAAAISVLTEPTMFDGSLDHLAQVRAAVDLPLLRKDFIVCEYQLVEAAVYGADAVLLIAAGLSDEGLARLLDRGRAMGLAVLVEAHDRAEVDRAIAAGAAIVGINSRDLRTLSVDRAVLETVVTAVPASVVAVAESGIATTEDVARLSSLGYHAFLVGERLIAQPDPGAALRELRGR
ncbi:MAG TPA: indole-3-glycerol phosphate synthase TrpC [Vicinamibacterales bacterium]|nr:indole-3-glycerol phosphate synthase TrpC [Vicinamibacterales bacterium]